MKQTVFALVGFLMLWGPLVFLPGCTNSQAATFPDNQLDQSARESSLEKELRTIMEKGISLDERKAQVFAIEQEFRKKTSPDRARNLAALCYFKTLGTIFTPFDLAEIALVESGGHRLSSKATSYMGAMGVWQLMPSQARHHGYTPEEMRDDEKCAEAAVRTLTQKLERAGGDLQKAKRLYCGRGPQADAYLKKISAVREILTANLQP